MSLLSDRYPRTVEVARGEVSLELMSGADEGEMLEFARALPVHDLLFLRRDITHPKVLSAWSDEIEAGSIVSLVAREAGVIVGCSAVVTDSLSFSPTWASSGCWSLPRAATGASAGSSFRRASSSPSASSSRSSWPR